MEDLEVRSNSSNNQKVVTIPAGSDIEGGDKVRVIRLGQYWDGLPGTLKTYQNLSNILKELVRADNELDDEDYNQAKEAIDKVREAGELVGEAMKMLDDEFGLVEDPGKQSD